MDHQEVNISAIQVLKLIHRYINFPFSQICKHSVACDFLSLLEENGYPVTNDFKNLVKHVLDASAGDEAANILLSKMMESEK